MVDALVLGTSGAIRGSSSLPLGTNLSKARIFAEGESQSFGFRGDLKGGICCERLASNNEPGSRTLMILECEARTKSLVICDQVSPSAQI